MELKMENSDKRSNLRAKFTREGNMDFVEISIVGDSSVYRGQASPEDVKKFPAEWDAYQKGVAEIEIIGTSLMEVPGVDADRKRHLMLIGIRTTEELASLSDLACQKIGIGGLSLRKAAQNLLAAERLKAMDAVVSEKKKPGRPKKVHVETGEVTEQP